MRQTLDFVLTIFFYYKLIVFFGEKSIVTCILCSVQCALKGRERGKPLDKWPICKLRCCHFFFLLYPPKTPSVGSEKNAETECNLSDWRHHGTAQSFCDSLPQISISWLCQWHKNLCSVQNLYAFFSCGIVRFLSYFWRVFNSGFWLLFFFIMPVVVFLGDNYVMKNSCVTMNMTLVNRLLIFSGWRRSQWINTKWRLKRICERREFFYCFLPTADWKDAIE